MRMIVIKQGTELKALGAQLFDSGALREGALAGLQRLNPQADFARLEPSTVLLVPEQADLREGETSSIGGDAFAAFAEQVRASVDAIVGRVQSGHQGRLDRQTETAAELQSPTLQNLLARIPDLSNEVGAALQVFDEDRKQAEVANTLLQTLEQELAAELDALRKLLG